MKIPQDKISLAALIFVSVLFSFHIFYLLSQLFLGTGVSLSQPSTIGAAFSILVSLVLLGLFFTWRQQWPYLMSALFFLGLSFTLKEIAGFFAPDEQFSFDLLVTILRIIMCVLFALGLLQGEMRRLVVRLGDQTNLDQ